MKETTKAQKPKLLPFKAKSLVKIITNKENIKTQEIQKKKTFLLDPQVTKKSASLQTSLRHRKRKDTIKLESKVQQLKKITQKSKRRQDDVYLRPAHSVELRKNRFNIDFEESKAFSLSANKKMKRSIESVREIVKKFNKTIQLTPSSFANDVVTESFQQKRITMPIELYRTLVESKRIKSKPNSRRNSTVKNPCSSSKQHIKPKKVLKKKKTSNDLCWPRSILEDRVSDVVRLSTCQDKFSIIESTEIQQATLTQNQDFNLEQLRQLQLQGKMIKKKHKEPQSNSYFNMMASKIQRFWREYKTKKILSRHITPSASHNNTIQLPYETFYGSIFPDRHNTHISNLENSDKSKSQVYQSVIKNIKIQQLQKWDQLIEMVEQSIKDNTGTKELLQKLIEQSQINKLALEENTDQMFSISFKDSPDKKQRSLNFPSEQSISHAASPVSNKKLFNQKGTDSFLKDSSKEEDSIQIKIAVEKLKQKLVQLNENSSEKRLVSEQSPYLVRDRRSLDREETISVSSSQEQDDDQDQHPIHKLISFMTQHHDKQSLATQLAESLLQYQVSLLLKDLATSSKLYRQLKLHIKQSSEKVIPKKPKKMKGIKSNLTAVKQYIKSLGDFLINLEGQPLRGLQEPSGPTTMEMLKYMRFYDDEEEEDTDGDDEIILSSEVFEQHWLMYSSSLSFPITYNDEETEFNHQDFLKRLTNIHCRSIFDTLNQSLDMLRNYGHFGKPFPWKKVPNFFHEFRQKQQKVALELGIQKTIEVASNFCGLILDKEQYGTVNVPSNQYVQQMHEERLSRSLAQELIEGQQKWVFYDDEETQILIQIAYSVNERLIAEVAQFLYKHYV